MDMRRSSSAAAWLPALALAAGGCGAGPGETCAESSDCGPGLLCSPWTRTCLDPGAEPEIRATDAGAPLPGTDAYMPPGTDAYMPPPGTDAAVPPSDGATGAPCTSDFECAPAGPGSTPLCGTPAEGLPGGYCTNLNCSTTTQDCPGDDAVCWAPDATFEPSCLDGCDPAVGDADCRAGYNCLDFGAPFGRPGGPYVCLPYCFSDADCPGGTCDMTSLTCV